MKFNLVSLAVFLAGVAAAPLPGTAASLTIANVDPSFPFVSQVYAGNGSETTSPALWTSAPDDTTSPALWTSAPNDTTSSLATHTYTPNADPPAVPEPPTWAMLILGAGVIGYAARRRSLRVAPGPVVQVPLSCDLDPTNWL
jgi:PEP-CTERM motif